MQCRRYIAKAFRIKRPKSLFFILNRALFSSQIPGDISLLGKVGLKNIIQVHPLCFSFFFFLLTSRQVSSWKGNAVLATKRRKLDTNTSSNRNNPIKSINIFFKKHLDNLKSSIFNSFSLSAENANLILTSMYAHYHSSSPSLLLCFFFLLTSCQVSSWKGNAYYLATKRRKLENNTSSNRNNPKSNNIFFKKHLDNLKSSIFNSFSLSAKNAILILTFMYAHFKCRVVVEALTKIHAVPTLIATLSSSKLISSSLSFG
jgi:hypothetical protein